MIVEWRLMSYKWMYLLTNSDKRVIPPAYYVEFSFFNGVWLEFCEVFIVISGSALLGSTS